MKKILLIFLFVQFSIVSYCQLDKKTWLLGGSGNFSATKNSTENDIFLVKSELLNINLNPNIGYFVIDKLALGINQTFSWFKDENNTSGGLITKQTRYDIGPFIRYYFLPKEKSFNLFADANYLIGTFKLYDIKGKRKSYTFKAGSSLFFNETVALDFSFGYNYSLEDIRNTALTRITENKGLIVGIGFQFHLSK